VAPLPSPVASPPPAPVPVVEPPSPLERGRALLARGEAGSALPVLREALRLEPDRLEARASLAQALYAVGDLDAALEEGRAVLRRDPDMAGARLPVAGALMARHDWAGARAELDEAVRRRPDLLQAHLSLGLVRYTQGDLEGAIASYRRVLELEPGHTDARLSLALALKLARREGEAARELTAAAEAGLPRAQYFLGSAYAQGGGVRRDLVRAIGWWMRAGDGGVAQAEEALAQLRQVALGRTRHALAERQAVEQAFRDYRAGLWSEFPELARGAAEDGVGVALLRRGRAVDALPVLIREAAALGEPAQRQLELLYERGVAGQLSPHDGRVLVWMRAAAAEGQPGPRLALARIYAQGLGVPRDVGRAATLLRSTPGEEAQRLLRELQR
jgi:TPR repeat protein